MTNQSNNCGSFAQAAPQSSAKSSSRQAVYGRQGLRLLLSGLQQSAIPKNVSVTHTLVPSQVSGCSALQQR